jgi:hypothetical protein
VTHAALAAAVSGRREVSAPDYLAHSLLDHNGHLTGRHDTEATEAAIGEARDIARSLRCQPLPDRAATITPPKPRCRIRSPRYPIWEDPDRRRISQVPAP